MSRCCKVTYQNRLILRHEIKCSPACSTHVDVGKYPMQVKLLNVWKPVGKHLCKSHVNRDINDWRYAQGLPCLT